MMAYAIFWQLQHDDIMQIQNYFDYTITKGFRETRVAILKKSVIYFYSTAEQCSKKMKGLFKGS